MKIIAWNVNGIRSRIFNENISSKLKKNEQIVPCEGSPIIKLLEEHDPDLLFFQETRCSIVNSNKINIPGYKSFFNESKLEGARSCDRYSGSAVFYKDTLEISDISIQIPGYNDEEGRIIILRIHGTSVISVYAPNSGTNYDNKILFMENVLNYINTLDKVIFCGDLNIAVSTHFDKTASVPGPGFYPHELQFYDDLIDIGLKDTINDDPIVYTWWDPRQRKENGMSICRNRNKGWRLDYFFTKNINHASSKCLKCIGENNQGIPLASDHAPVILNYDLE